MLEMGFHWPNSTCLNFVDVGGSNLEGGGEGVGPKPPGLGPYC